MSVLGDVAHFQFIPSLDTMAFWEFKALSVATATRTPLLEAILAHF